MEFQYQQSSQVFEVMAPFVFVVTVGVGIFWMVVGWRAMRAHERLAEATKDLAKRDQG